MSIEFNNTTEYEIDEGNIKNAILATLDYCTGGTFCPPAGEHAGSPLHQPLTCDISVAIVSKSEIQGLNKKYRGKDCITDVLSFPMHEDGLLGDIIICYEQAEKQARELGQSIEKELAFLSIHSTLHLLGYDHKDKHREEEMFTLQKEIIKKLLRN